jgi:ligand-binding sensor domain-containing protein
MKNRLLRFAAIMACAGFAAAPSAESSFENISNYASPVTVNAFLQWGDTLWAATSGGLVTRGLSGGVQKFDGNGRVFPDLYLTALCRDDAGNLWVGSRKGYLYRRSPHGQYTVFSTYRLSGWSITALYCYDGMIVVGSDRGVSLFDPAKGVAARNATAIAGFADPRVNAIEASGDTLFLGCAEGVAFIDSLYDSPLAQRNFYYPGIWKTKETGAALCFVDVGDSIAAFRKPTALFRGYLFTVDSGGWLTSGGLRYARVVPEGGVVTLYNEGDKRLWAGTDERFYYSWDGETQPQQHTIAGYSLKRASRVVTAPNGNVWVLPAVFYPNAAATPPIFWYHGVHTFDGRNWRIYSDAYSAGFGYVGDNNALGAAFWKDSSIWVGTSGGNIKHIDPARDVVGQFIVGNAGFTGIGYLRDGRGENMWGKCDAVAADLSGYLWFSVYDSDFGSLICYDPRYSPAPVETNPVKAHYRRFFTESSLKTNIELLAVNGGGEIFAYGGNRLVAFSHGGNPLAGGIKIDTVYESIGTLWAMEAGPDSALYIAGAGGIRRIPAGSLTVETIDNTINNASGIAVDDGVIWISTGVSGVVRYDLESKEKRWINETSGLASNNAVSVALDKKNGRLWIATDEGVSMVSVGRTGKKSPKPALRAIPNMYSASGSSQGAAQITFCGLKPKSSVAVYAINGTLAAKAEARYYSDTEWRAAWAPKKNIAPGTYIAVVKPGGEKTKIIIKP